MDLLTVIKSHTLLEKFLQDDIKSILFDLEFNAASEAMASVPNAKDKKSAYWSVINHLQSAEQALKAQISSVHRYEAARKYFYVSALKAIIFRYLKEEDLVVECYSQSLKIAALQRQYAEESQFKDIFSSLNPLNWFKTARHYHSRYGKFVASFQVANFWKQFLGKDGDFSLLLISEDGIDLR